MVKLQMTNTVFLGEGAGPAGSVRNWQIRFVIDGPGLQTSIDVPVEGPIDDIGGWQAQINALGRLREFLRHASEAADKTKIGSY